MSLAEKRILVTGATGFIGGRLVERLVLQHGARVSALVHNFTHASRLARFPIPMRAGDVTDQEAVARAAEGCDAIIHCAVTFSGGAANVRKVIVEGARNVAAAARRAGVKQVVHLSTFSVYGRTPPGPLTEAMRPAPGRDAYAAGKLEAETVMGGLAGEGVRVVILQPTIVYGPFSFWSLHPARQLRLGDVVLPHGGAGLCNAVYVDDVARVIETALQGEVSSSTPYLISGAAPVTWWDYYSAYVRTFPGARLISMSAPAIRARSAARRFAQQLVGHFSHERRASVGGVLDRHPALRAKYNRMMGRPPPAAASAVVRTDGGGRAPSLRNRPAIFPDRAHLPLFLSRTNVLCARARAELAYVPIFSLDKGMEITYEWLKWMGLISPDAAVESAAGDS
jgi:nucleoside-diphosphate-sugar epimerase